MRDHTFMDNQFNRKDFNPNDRGDFTKNKVFVAMPFKDEMTEVFYTIKYEAHKLGLKAFRVDENVNSGFIIKDITQGIEDAEFVIFDLTDERPNVYYELGYAHGVGNEGEDILLIAKEGTKIHFDIAPLRIRYYDSIDSLKAMIYLSLKTMIESTR